MSRRAVARPALVAALWLGGIGSAAGDRPAAPSTLQEINRALDAVAGERVIEAARRRQLTASDLRYLLQGGGHLATRSYQRRVGRVVASFSARIGVSAADFGGQPLRSMVIEGPPRSLASEPGAWAASGNLLTITRRFVDLADVVGAAYVGAKDESNLLRNLEQVARWELGRGPRPRFVASVAGRRSAGAMAEDVVGAVLLHEMGHLFAGHREPPSIGSYYRGQRQGPRNVIRARARVLQPRATTTPTGRTIRWPAGPKRAIVRPRDANTTALWMEGQADLIAARAAPAALAHPQALALATLYEHVRAGLCDGVRATPRARDPIDAVRRSHPPAAKRYNLALRELRRAGLLRDSKLPPRLVAPRGFR